MPHISVEGSGIKAELTHEAVEELCGMLKTRAGIYVCRKVPLTVELVPTIIRDRNGNELRTIE